MKRLRPCTSVKASCCLQDDIERQRLLGAILWRGLAENKPLLLVDLVCLALRFLSRRLRLRCGRSCDVREEAKTAICTGGPWLGVAVRGRFERRAT